METIKTKIIPLVWKDCEVTPRTRIIKKANCKLLNLEYGIRALGVHFEVLLNGNSGFFWNGSCQSYDSFNEAKLGAERDYLKRLNDIFSLYTDLNLELEISK